jgi:hypothetical protein
MFYFSVSSQSKIDRQRVTDLLVKASDDIICDPRQTSNCVEKGEDKTDHPKIGPRTGVDIHSMVDRGQLLERFSNRLQVWRRGCWGGHFVSLQ